MAEFQPKLWLSAAPDKSGDKIDVTLGQAEAPCEPLFLDVMPDSEPSPMRPLTLIDMTFTDLATGEILQNSPVVHGDHRGIIAGEIIRLDCDRHVGWKISIGSGMAWKYSVARGRSYSVRVCAESQMKSFYANRSRQLRELGIDSRHAKRAFKDFSVCAPSFTFRFDPQEEQPTELRNKELRSDPKN